LKKVPWKSETEAAREAREAIEKFDQALCLDQYDWRAWAGRGDGFMRLKQYGKATKALRRALTINPNDSYVSERLKKSLTKSKPGKLSFWAKR
jgi:tetratricopeptide (TPR) repeat protein